MIEQRTIPVNYTKCVTLTFERSELMNDIKNIGYVESDVIEDESLHSRHQVADIAEDGNVERVCRIMDLAFAECVEYLYPISKKQVQGGEVYNNVLEHTDVYELELKVPEDFSTTTCTLLERYIHEYIICRVLEDWMGIAGVANRDSAKKWAAKIEEVRANLTRGLSGRIGRVRLRQDPF